MTQPSSSRNGRKVRLVAIHTAEGARTVESLDAFFRREKTGSSHAGVDDKRLVEGWVPYDRAAWTLRSGNPISDNLELCAFASWSRAEWLRHDDMLTMTARWIAQRCKVRGVPCVKISAADVRAGKSGVIGHVDWTNGMKDGSHWDPGPNFPWDVVMSRAQGGSAASTQEDDMTPEEKRQLKFVFDAIRNGGADMPDNGRSLSQSLANLVDVTYEGGTGTPRDQTLYQRVARIEAAVAAIADRLGKQ